MLFLCTGNSARSQMSEAFATHLGKGKYDFFSAGTVPSNAVHPIAILVMDEKGIDMTGQKPKNIADIPIQFDHVIAVCSHAADNCPVIPGADMERWDIDDPAAATGSDETQRAVFQRVRDEIEVRVREWLIQHDRG